MKNRHINIAIALFVEITMTTLALFSQTNQFFKPEEGFVSVTGGKIWYQICATEHGQKTPLLILHGGPGMPHNHLKVLEKISQDRPVIFYDQLGCGRSAAPNLTPDLWTLPRFVEELEILVKALGLEKFHIIGHSWGGSLATEYALKHPEKIKTLILASPLLSTQLWEEDAQRLLSQLPPQTRDTILRHEQAGTTDSEEYFEAATIFNQTFVCRIKPLPDDRIPSLDSPCNLETYRTMWGPSEFCATGNLKNFDRFNDLVLLSMPVLITCGQFDEATPQTMQKALQKLQHGQLVIFENSAHIAHLEETEKYLQVVSDFLTMTEIKDIA